MQHFPTPAHGHHATAHYKTFTTLLLAATIPCRHLTAMIKLNFTKPLILHGKKLDYYLKKKKVLTTKQQCFNYLHNSYYLTNP
jgi:hypothetical protein